MGKVNMAKNKNRRVFFRIYDEVNLFYQKIDERLLTESHPDFDNVLKPSALSPDLEKASQGPAQLSPSLEKNLPDVTAPDFQFNEHETCNVNISASGMAFNCEDAFKEGDYLIIKILLVSSMTAIVTYGQVVYSKDHHLSDSENPYLVGAHFINMKDEDRELLIRHVAKKRLQQRWVGGLSLAAVITVIVAPDMVFGLLLEFLHFLLELFLHSLHLGFEFIEMNLDHLVEHLFHTDLHQTQVIVFYIIASFVLYAVYRLCWALPLLYRRFKKNQILYWSRKKASLLYYWQDQSLFDKCKLVVIGIAAITCYIFFGM